MSSILTKAWIIDSIASDHIVCDERFLSHICKSTHNTLVQLLNESDTLVTKIGNVLLNP